jgi:hypothetical protein
MPFVGIGEDDALINCGSAGAAGLGAAASAAALRARVRLTI